MIIRIVKMSFEPSKITDFKAHFETVRDQIKTFDGNCFLELYQDKDNRSTFFTYSHWQSIGDLENYRQSDFFKKVWSETKPMFNDKPEAWSLLQQ